MFFCVMFCTVNIVFLYEYSCTSKMQWLVHSWVDATPEDYVVHYADYIKNTPSWYRVSVSCIWITGGVRHQLLLPFDRGGLRTQNRTNRWATDAIIVYEWLSGSMLLVVGWLSLVYSRFFPRIIALFCYYYNDSSTNNDIFTINMAYSFS